MLRIVYTSDLHGNVNLYRAAGDAAIRTHADALCFGGDLCPGTPSGASRRLPVEQPEFLVRRLRPLLADWKKAHPCLRIFAIPGNDDCQTVLPALDALARDDLIENLHGEVRRLGSYSLVGLSYVPPTPFQLKDFERWDEEPDPDSDSYRYRCVVGKAGGFSVIDNFHSHLNALSSIKDELERLVIEDPEHTVAVIHTPPFHTHCDVLFDGRHVGSKAVRNWIAKYKPRLTLHGHIHESPQLSRSFCDRIGSTIVINPGCDHSRPHLVFLDVDNLSELEHSIYGKTGAPGARIPTP